ncbi:hypothetical protein CYMTET_42931, partial [Cymbomonas tetramitiformis]
MISFVGILSTTVGANQPYVSEISPVFGSVHGNTEVTITGANLQPSGDPLDSSKLQVSFYFAQDNNITEYPCEVESYYSTSSQIVCRTSPALDLIPVGEFSKPLPLLLQVDGQSWMHMYGTDEPMYSMTTSFTYSWHHTPMVYGAEPTYAVPGGLIKIHGRVCGQVNQMDYIIVGDTLCYTTKDGVNDGPELPLAGRMLSPNATSNSVSISTLTTKASPIELPSLVWLNNTAAGANVHKISAVAATFGRQTTETSSYNTHCSATRCIDGDVTTGFSCNAGTSMCHSPAWYADVWLRVDLGMKHLVHGVQLFNRKDCCTNRVNYHEIWVGDGKRSPAGNGNTLCYEGRVANGFISIYDACSQKMGLAGRYVFIFLPGAERVFALQEVEVYGTSEDKMKSGYTCLTGETSYSSGATISEQECCVGWLYCRLPDGMPKGVFNVSISSSKYGDGAHQDDSVERLPSGIGHVEVFDGIERVHTDETTSIISIFGNELDVDSDVYVGVDRCISVSLGEEGELLCEPPGDINPLYNISSKEGYPGGPGIVRRWWALDDGPENFTRITDLSTLKDFVDDHETNGYAFTRNGPSEVVDVDTQGRLPTEGDIKMDEYPLGIPLYYHAGDWAPICMPAASRCTVSDGCSNTYELHSSDWDPAGMPAAFCRHFGYAHGRAVAKNVENRAQLDLNGVFVGQCAEGETFGNCLQWETGHTCDEYRNQMGCPKCGAGSYVLRQIECVGLEGAMPAGLVNFGEDTVASLAVDADTFMALGAAKLAFQLSGLFVPHSTSEHRFSIWAGGAGAVYLSNDQQRGGMQEISRQKFGAVARNWTTSEWIVLQKGVQYYLEALFTAEHPAAYAEVAVEVRNPVVSHPDVISEAATSNNTLGSRYRGWIRNNFTAGGLQQEVQVAQVYSDDVAAFVELDMSAASSWPEDGVPLPDALPLLHWPLDAEDTGYSIDEADQSLALLDISGNSHHGHITEELQAAYLNLTAGLDTNTAPLGFPGSLKLSAQHAAKVPSAATEELRAEAVDGAATLALWMRPSDDARAVLASADAASGANLRVSIYDYEGDAECAAGIRSSMDASGRVACCPADCGTCAPESGEGAESWCTNMGRERCCADAIVAGSASCYTYQAPCSVGLESTWWEEQPGLSGAVTITAGITGCTDFMHQAIPSSQLSSSHGWWDGCLSATLSDNPWYDVITPSTEVRVGGIVLMGCHGRWAEAFTAHYRESKTATWKDVDNGRVFAGNSQSNTEKDVLFTYPVHAQAIRIVPKSDTSTAQRYSWTSIPVTLALLVCGNVALGREVAMPGDYEDYTHSYGLDYGAPPAPPEEEDLSHLTLTDGDVGDGTGGWKYTERTCLPVGLSEGGVGSVTVDLAVEQTVASVQLSGNSGGCASEWTLFNGRCYRLFSSATWSNARTSCQGFPGGDLATIPSAEIQEVLSSLRGGTSNSFVFVGGYAVDGNWEWGWINGAEWEYENWYRDEPSSTSEDCLTLMKSGSWNDLSCGSTRPYICEADLEKPETKWTVHVGHNGDQGDALCGELTGNMLSGMQLVQCEAPVAGRYITAALSGSNVAASPPYLCELEAYHPRSEAWLSSSDLVSPHETDDARRVADDRWTHVTLVISNRTLEKYIDGQLIASAEGGASLFQRLGQLAGELQIAPAGSLYGFAGHVADVRLYRAPLSPQEVVALVSAAQHWGNHSSPRSPQTLTGEIRMEDSSSGRTSMPLRWSALPGAVREAVRQTLQEPVTCTFNASIADQADLVYHAFDDLSAHTAWDGAPGFGVVHDDPLCGLGALEADAGEAPLLLFSGSVKVSAYPYMSMGLKVPNGTLANMLLRVGLPSGNTFYCSVVLSYTAGAFDQEWWAPPCASWSFAAPLQTDSTWQWIEINLLEQMYNYFWLYAPPAPSDSEPQSFEIHEIWLDGPGLRTTSGSHLYEERPWQSGRAMGGTLWIDEMRLSSLPRDELTRSGDQLGLAIANMEVEFLLDVDSLRAGSFPFPYRWRVSVLPGVCVHEAWLAGLSVSSDVRTTVPDSGGWSSEVSVRAADITLEVSADAHAGNQMGGTLRFKLGSETVQVPVGAGAAEVAEILTAALPSVAPVQVTMLSEPVTAWKYPSEPSTSQSTGGGQQQNSLTLNDARLVLETRWAGDYEDAQRGQIAGIDAARSAWDALTPEETHHPYCPATFVDGPEISNVGCGGAADAAAGSIAYKVTYLFKVCPSQEGPWQFIFIMPGEDVEIQYSLDDQDEASVGMLAGSEVRISRDLGSGWHSIELFAFVWIGGGEAGELRTSPGLEACRAAPLCNRVQYEVAYSEDVGDVLDELSLDTSDVALPPMAGKAYTSSRLKQHGGLFVVPIGQSLVQSIVSEPIVTIRTREGRLLDCMESDDDGACAVEDTLAPPPAALPPPFPPPIDDGIMWSPDPFIPSPPPGTPPCPWPPPPAPPSPPQFPPSVSPTATSPPTNTPTSPISISPTVTGAVLMEVVHSTVRFSDLEMSAFDNVSFALSFRSAFASQMAAGGGVTTEDVSIVSIASGSAQVVSTVDFPITATSTAANFSTTLVSLPASVFRAFGTTYGSITANATIERSVR